MKPIRPNRPSERQGPRYLAARPLTRGRRVMTPREPLLSTSAKLRLAFGFALLGVLAIALRFLSGAQFVVSSTPGAANPIVMESAPGVDAAQVINASGLNGGNVLWLNLHPTEMSDAVERVKRLPGIDAARVTCHLGPPAGCAIAVQPAQPVVVFKSASGNLWLSRKGQAMRASSDVAPGLITLSVEDPASLPTIGENFGNRLTRAVDEIAGMNLELTDMLFARDTGITLVLPRGLRVRVGWADDARSISDKMNVARQLAAQLAARGTIARIIDVRHLDAPYFIE